MKTHQIIKTIEHKGIKVPIKVDFDLGTASLVEKDINGKWKKKEFMFADRTLAYMNGWITILEAQIKAVEECKKLLEEAEKEKAEVVMNIVTGLSSAGKE